MGQDKVRLPCDGQQDLFFSDELDGRKEEEREARELLAVSLCAGCTARIPCLELALVWNEPHGVWGGMSEQERRNFRQHLREEGYGREIPTGVELQASLKSWYKSQEDERGDLPAKKIS